VLLLLLLLVLVLVVAEQTLHSYASVQAPLSVSEMHCAPDRRDASVSIE